MDCYLTFHGFVLTLIIQLSARKLYRQSRNYTYGYVLTCMTIIVCFEKDTAYFGQMYKLSIS